MVDVLVLLRGDMVVASDLWRKCGSFLCSFHCFCNFGGAGYNCYNDFSKNLFFFFFLFLFFFFLFLFFFFTDQVVFWCHCFDQVLNVMMMVYNICFLLKLPSLFFLLDSKYYLLILDSKDFIFLNYVFVLPI